MHPQALFVCSCLHDVINCLCLKEKLSIEMACAACWCSLRFICHSSFRSTMFTMSTICEMHTRVNIMDEYVANTLTLFPISMCKYLMGTKVGLVLKILCKFHMGQLQDQEPRRLRKQCKDWWNPLGMKLARAQHSRWVWKMENQFWSTWYKLWKTWLRVIVWAYCYWRVSIC